MPRVRLAAEGRVVVVSEATRSRTQNIEDARQRLAALVARALVAPKKRKPTRPSRASRQRRLEAKTRQSERKRARSRVQRDTD
jgi:ribosome-associated protein